MKLSFKNKTFEGEVPALTKWLYTSSGAFRDASYQFVSMFLLTYVQFCALGGVAFEEYLAMYGAISIIVIILRIWDGVNDPIMGYIIEKCNFKMGKYRPWILIGALLNSVITIIMFWVQPTGWDYVIFFAIFYFLWDFTYTINDISFWSVLPSLSQKEKVRANLTTTLSIFISVGTFAVGGIVPLVSAGEQELTYKVISLITSSLFFLSQLILVIFMKERKIPQEEQKSNEKIKIKDIFSVIFKNDQLRVSIIAMLLFYTGSGILVAAGLNFFYFCYGYSIGGGYQFIFTVIFALATFAAQFLYQPLVNKFKLSKMKIFTIMSIMTIVSYIGLFLFIFVPNYITYFPVLCVFAFFAFFGQTIMSLIIYIMIQDTIDYNQYKFNERRESSIFSLRAFTAKLAGSVQQGILYIFLMLSALFQVSQSIANLEREFKGDADYIKAQADLLTGAENITLNQRVIFHVGFTIIPLLLFLGAFLIIKFKYKITEESHEKMLTEISQRKIVSDDNN